MAFMTPVVRKDWDVWAKQKAASRPTQSPSNVPRIVIQQASGFRSVDGNLSTSPGKSSPAGLYRKRVVPLSTEIRNQQHLRVHGSMPSGIHSAHLGVPSSSEQPRNNNGRHLADSSRLSPIKATCNVTAAASSLPALNSAEGLSSSSNKIGSSGSQSSLHKFLHSRFVDRLRGFPRTTKPAC